MFYFGWWDLLSGVCWSYLIDVFWIEESWGNKYIIFRWTIHAAAVQWGVVLVKCSGRVDIVLLLDSRPCDSSAFLWLLWNTWSTASSDDTHMNTHHTVIADSTDTLKTHAFEVSEAPEFSWGGWQCPEVRQPHLTMFPTLWICIQTHILWSAFILHSH